MRTCSHPHAGALSLMEVILAHTPQTCKPTRHQRTIRMRCQARRLETNRMKAYACMTTAIASCVIPRAKKGRTASTSFHTGSSCPACRRCLHMHACAICLHVTESDTERKCINTALWMRRNSGKSSTPSKRTPISPQPRTSFDIDGIADAVHRKHMHTG